MDKLSQEDIQALLSDPASGGAKVQVIEKLSSQYNSVDFTPEQVTLAEQIFRLLLKQAEVEVRKALADNLMMNPEVPSDVILSLARDVEEISLPVLEFSEVLTDSHLIEIISSTEKTASHIAVANRHNVSESVSDALIQTNNEEVVHSLLQNDSAQISDNGYSHVVDTFPRNQKIVEAMITHGSLSPQIIEKMTQKISSAIQAQLASKYQNSFQDINNFFQESSAVATLKFLGHQTLDKELITLVDSLREKGKLEQALHPISGMLTHLLDGLEELGRIAPLSALAAGDLTLFEISLSRMTNTPFVKTHEVILNQEDGLRTLYERADLPPKLFDAIAFSVNVVIKMEKESKLYKRPRAKDDLYLFLKRLGQESSGKRIPNLGHFIEVIKSHIEEEQSEW